MKTCSKCSEDKAPEEFNRRARSPDGLLTWCKSCMAEYHRQWQKANPQKVRAHASAHYYRNKDACLERNRAWWEKNPGKNTAKVKAYKLALERRVPPWADLDEIKAIYEEAARRRRSGENVVVDHIVPLRGRNVSGLHVAGNLRIISHAENASKGNKHVVD